MDSTMISGLVGCGGTLLGALLGACIGGYYNKMSAEKAIQAQMNILRQQEIIELQKEEEFVRLSAEAVFLDLSTAMLEGFNRLKGHEMMSIGATPLPLPINPQYAEAVAALRVILTPDESLAINRVYGLLHKIQRDIENSNYITSTFREVEFGYTALEVILFRESYPEIMKLDIDHITIDFLLDKLDVKYLVIRRLKEIATW